MKSLWFFFFIIAQGKIVWMNRDGGILTTAWMKYVLGVATSGDNEQICFGFIPGLLENALPHRNTWQCWRRGEECGLCKLVNPLFFRHLSSFITWLLLRKSMWLALLENSGSAVSAIRSAMMWCENSKWLFSAALYIPSPSCWDGFNVVFIIVSTKELMFLPVLVYLIVCEQHYSKN